MTPRRPKPHSEAPPRQADEPSPLTDDEMRDQVIVTAVVLPLDHAQHPIVPERNPSNSPLVTDALRPHFLVRDDEGDADE